MNLKKAIFSLCIFSGFAQAGLVETDWKTSGDGLATLHEETGIEWLDLTETDGMSIQQALSQAGQGGVFDGWRLPTINEIDTFARYAFNGWLPNNSTQAPGGSTNESTYRNFSDLLGLTHTVNNRRHSFGLGSDDNGNIFSFGVLGYTSGGTSTFFRSGYSETMSTTSTTRAEAGIYLVSDGGTTLSSIEQPELNINNASAPVNNATNVPASGIFAALFLTTVFSTRKRNK